MGDSIFDGIEDLTEVKYDSEDPYKNLNIQPHAKMESNSEIKPFALWPDHSGEDSKPLKSNPSATPVAADFRGFSQESNTSSTSHAKPKSVYGQQKIPCQICLKLISRRNMNSHVRKVHSHEEMEPNLEINPSASWPDHSGGNSKPLKSNPSATPVAPVTADFRGFSQESNTSSTSHAKPKSVDGQEKIPCQICLKLISRRTMSRHVRTVHSPKKPCQFCQKLVSRPSMSRHVRLVHSDEEMESNSETTVLESFLRLWEINPSALSLDHSGGDSKPLKSNPAVTVDFRGCTPHPIVSMYQGHPYRPYPPELSDLAGNPMPRLPKELMKQQKEKPYKCGNCDKAYSYAGQLGTHVKKTHEAPLKKAQNPYKDQQAICSMISRVLQRSPNEEFVSEAMQLFQNSGILKQQDIDRSMFEFMQGNRSESDLKLDMANLVYEGFAEHVFNLPPDL